jgi:cytochrome oxidase Cu insertion factor (SCO1/SenC/PrrC family)
MSRAAGVVARVPSAARVALAAAALTLSLGGSAVGAHEEAAQPAPLLRFEPPPAGSYALPVIQRVASHTLLDPSGAPAPLPGLGTGDVALIAFVYLSCGDACPMALAQLQRVDRAAAQDPLLAGHLRLLTVSFDPLRDSPEQMGRLREQLAPRGHWGFLTATDEAALAPVLEDYGQSVLASRGADGKPSGLLQHVLKVFLVDDAGAVRNVYSTGFLDSRLLLNDARTVRGAGAP